LLVGLKYRYRFQENVLGGRLVFDKAIRHQSIVVSIIAINR